MPTSTPCCSTCRPRKAPQRYRRQGDCRPRQALARAAGEQGQGRGDHCGELRRAPGTAARLRPDHRSHRRAHGLEEVRCTTRSRRTSRGMRSSPAIPRACRSTPWPKRCRSLVHPRFCGVHFFNPPRYMHLAELIPTASTDPEVLEGFESFLVHHAWQGRGARRTRRTSSATASACFRSFRRCTTPQAFGLGFDEVDALTGPLIGRPKRPPTAPRTWSASTPWRTSSRPWPTPCRTIPGTSTSRRRNGCKA
jgi:hypothetical protein